MLNALIYVAMIIRAVADITKAVLGYMKPKPKDDDK